jgi:signal transduction histidine kinase
VTEVAALARDVVRQLRPAAEARGVVISVSESLPVVVTDPSRLDLILTNLVSNAIRYSDPQKAVRRVDIDALDTEPGWWGLTGIFDRFTRAHAHRDAELGIEGGGLGLAIAKESAIASGGALSCQSVLQEGTVFVLRLPIRRHMPSR